MPRKPRNAVEPFATVISAIVALFGTAVAAGILGAVFGNGTFLRLGESSICVRTDHISTGFQGGDAALAHLVRPGIAVTNVGMSFCDNHPTAVQSVLAPLTEIPTFVLYTTAFLLLYRLVHGAMRHGPFSQTNARRVRIIGWWLTLGGLVATTAETLAHTALVRTMTAPSSQPYWDDGILSDIPWGLVITGLGLVTVARILRAGVEMQDDLAGTV